MAFFPCMNLFGYVDPGLGLLAWQTIVAAFLGVLFYLKKTRTWLVDLLCRPFRALKRRQRAEPSLQQSATDAPR